MENQLQFRIPCWVVVDQDMSRGPLLSILRHEGKSIIQIFLEQAEVERFIQEQGLPGKIPFQVSTVHYLLGLIVQLRKNGVAIVYVFFRAGEEFKRAEIPIDEFAAGLQKNMPI